MAEILAQGWAFCIENRLALLYVSASLLIIHYIFRLVDTDKERLHAKKLLYVNTLMATSVFTYLVFLIISSGYFGKMEPREIETLRVFSALVAVVALILMLLYSRLGLFKLNAVQFIMISFFVSAPVVELTYEGGIEKFLDQINGGGNVIEANGERSFIASVIIALYFFTTVLVAMQYYGEVIRIRHEYKLQSRERTGLDPLSLNRAILVFSFAVAFVVGLAMSGANLLGLGIFSGLLGAGLSLAFRDLLNNLVAGLILLWDKSVSVGDVIQMEDGWIGEIRNMTMRYALLMDRNQVEMIVPNSLLIGGAIRNFTRERPEVRQAVEIPIRLGSDIASALRVMETACIKCSRVSKSPKFPPKGFFISHTEYATLLEIRFWISDAEKGISNIKSEVGLKVTQALAEEDYELPIPRQEVTLSGQQQKGVVKANREGPNPPIRRLPRP